MTRPRRERLALLVAILLVGALASGSALGNSRPDRPDAFSVSVTATPSYGTPPLTVSFQASVSSGTPTGFNWTFEDGSFYNGTNASASSPSHTFSAPGLYNVTVIVYEGTVSASAEISVHVVAELLSASVEASAVEGSAPTTITFTAEVTGGTGTYVNYTWQFGDGGTGTGPSVRYTYLRPGTFHAVLTVYDSANASTTAGVWLNITPASTGGASSIPWTDIGLGVGGALLLGVLAVWLIVRRRPPSPGPDATADERGVAAPAAPGPVPSDETLRISQRIVVHLSQQGRLGPDEVATVGFTQGGISRALGVPQTSLTNVLRRLEAGGLVTVDTRHVRGQPRRLKIYRLTARGEELARELRHPPPNSGSSPPFVGGRE